MAEADGGAEPHPPRDGASQPPRTATEGMVVLLLANAILSSDPYSLMPGPPVDVGAVDEGIASRLPHVDDTVPATFDWLQANPNCTSPIQNQRSCGSCWAFAATGVLADRQCAKTGQPVTMLSVQDLLNCDDILGCTMGVLPGMAWKSLERNGVATAACLPYRSIISCMSSWPAVGGGRA